MVPLIYVYYYGEQQIEYWEYACGFLYMVAIYAYFARKKRVLQKTYPEYRYFLYGLGAKLFAVFVFTLIYFYYYEGGDSQAFYYSALSMRNMAFKDPAEYITQMLGDNSMRAWSTYTFETRKPYQFTFFDQRIFAVVRLTSLVTFFTMGSYLISNLIVASLSFFGVWACYRTFVSYFPAAAGRLAVAFLFMPSVVFWGSPILKDMFTFGAVCWWVHAVDEVFFKRRDVLSRVITMVLSGGTIVFIKPYIFMVLLPATLAWVGYFRVARIRNTMVKFVLLPIFVIGLALASVTILDWMGDSFDKFALDKALETIEVTQGDLSKQDSYGSNSFDLGTFDGTWGGVVAKAPIAINATLFRPYIWEANNIAMALSGLENLWVLGFTLWVFWKAGPRFVFQCIGGVPLLLMATMFALLFSFAVGVTTPNFGALVRFKIPMVPFYIATLYIILHLSELRREKRSRGLRFDVREYRSGTAHIAPAGDVPAG